MEYNKLLVDAVLDKAFPQNMILSPEEFVRRMETFSLHIMIESLETWNRLDILNPIISVRDEPSIINQEMINNWRKRREEIVIIPNQANFRPWSEYKNTESNVNRVSLFYHPYQVFRFFNIYGKSRKKFSFDDFDNQRELWMKEAYNIQKELSENLDVLKNSAESDAQHLCLLILIEDKYLPKIRRRTEPPFDQEDSANGWHKWQEEFDPREVLKKSGLSVEQALLFRRRLAEKVCVFDPNFEWYLLLRHSDYSRRKRLRNKAVLAWEYYEAVELLGLFLEEITGESQPHADDLLDPTHGKWKMKRYGIAPEKFDYGWGNALPSILRIYGLDPRTRVLFIVEGQSEEKFIHTWCEKINIFLDQWRVRVVPLKGIDNSKNLGVEQYIRDANADGASVIVVLDDENDSHKQMEDWKEKRLILRIFDASELSDPKRLPIGAMIWKQFEEDNFDMEELLIAWKEVTRAIQGKTDPTLVEKAAAEAKDYLAKEPKMLKIKAIEKVAKQYQLYFNKVNIAEALAKRCESNDKPIILLIQNVLMIANISRTMSERRHD